MTSSSSLPVKGSTPPRHRRTYRIIAFFMLKGVKSSYYINPSIHSFRLRAINDAIHVIYFSKIPAREFLWYFSLSHIAITINYYFVEPHKETVPQYVSQQYRARLQISSKQERAEKFFLSVFLNGFCVVMSMILCLVMFLSLRWWIIIMPATTPTNIHYDSLISLVRDNIVQVSTKC